jgi:ATP-dependent RNA helicase DDX23/PRP28
MAPPPVPSGNQKSSNEPASNGGPDDGTGMSTTELAAIRSRYLGVDKKKRVIRKMSDRKFVFDWAEQDDTFAMDSPSAVGSQRQGAAVMFGRGHLAGMENSSVPHIPRHDSSTGAPTNAMVMDPAGSLTRRKDDRHWSEKPIEEMKDRDWRIFREDFSISARGICDSASEYGISSDGSFRWKYTPSIAILGGILHTTAATRCHCYDWLQGAIAYPAASYPYWASKP